ncbi:translation elongation factor 2 [Dacryopinax primogenitus]|uniref:Ribosome assembly protein 1 n=1 Tax=Dacryopinax primogenitus (strain DJM 731) TaxID=1858805 RepID=M5FYV3_DACPD|nr:translation elongation factor 2 [Dacryopinax primogenitus]EJU03216.1 translation elongation factor 2 [Dacryopinax primogenitus]
MSAASDPSHVRNITVTGHVDHGKTTFVDSLLAANNIISARMAGKIRFLDSREDEQERGITMESSAVSLRFQVLRRNATGNDFLESFVINLIDTPGHVDFSIEVSTASRLCDGALVLVDAVEGVCTQTISVLRQAWQDRLRPILVINKIDRLITELQLSPIEAHHHLSQVVEQVNAVMGSFFASERMEDDLRWREEREKRLQMRKEKESGLEDAAGDEIVFHEFQERDDEDIYFTPERGNVIFASAIDAWAFRIGTFSRLYADKLGIKEESLRRTLWGDFFLDPKTKRVVGRKGLKGRNLKPMFVQFVLENIWAVYHNVVITPNQDKVNKIVSTLNLKIQPRDLNSKDSRHLLSVIFSKWLSLASCTFQAVVDVIPPPSVAQRTRLPKVLYPDLHEQAVNAKTRLEENLYSCDASDGASVVAYVSKMFAVPSKELPENKQRGLTAEEMRQRGRDARVRRSQVEEGSLEDRAIAVREDSVEPSGETVSKNPSAVVENDNTEALLGFARIYSGTMKQGTHMYCVLPRYDASLGPRHASNIKHLQVIQVTTLYTIMGRDLVPVQAVPAGNVFAIGGLGGVVLRNATLCSPNGASIHSEDSIASNEVESDCLVNLSSTGYQAAPIVRVALEPAEPANMPKLIRGLRLLSQADPCVETFQQQTGEYVIITAGELHLERCLKDLRERFAKIDIQASKPIVPFRETAIRVAEMAPPKSQDLPRGTVKGSSTQGLVTFSIRARPLPSSVISFLQSNVHVIQEIQGGRGMQRVTSNVRTRVEGVLAMEEDVLGEETENRPTVQPQGFWTELEELLTAAGPDWSKIADQIWAFGPKRIGSCMLIDQTGGSFRSLRRRTSTETRESGVEVSAEQPNFVSDSNALSLHSPVYFDAAVETGFQIATFQGPLCAEPVVGMAYFVQNLNYDLAVLEMEENRIRLPQITGSVITGVREACRAGMVDWSPRLMMAMYACDIQASTDVLGKVYGVISRRRGRIVAEEMKEGTSFFTIRALLPVVESFGFADDIRKRTSGAASPQLIFNGYEILDQDPFWVPTTEEELEDLGEKADRINIAKMYMDAVRERKGLSVDKKIVEFAEKQRTLKR